MNVQWIGANTNNYQKGRNGKTVELIICHWIVGRLPAADATFQDPNRQASAHYGVGGTAVHQYVDESNTAYHAGNFDINLKSIGIEHEGGPDIPITVDTYNTSAELIALLAKRYKVPLDRAHVKKHNEVSNTATQCPGTLNLDLLISKARQINQGSTPTPIPPPTQTEDEIRGIQTLKGYRQSREQGPEGNFEGYCNALVGSDREVAQLRATVKTMSDFNSQVSARLSQCRMDLQKAQESANPHPDNENIPPTVSEAMKNLLAALAAAFSGK